MSFSVVAMALQHVLVRGEDDRASTPRARYVRRRASGVHRRTRMRIVVPITVAEAWTPPRKRKTRWRPVTVDAQFDVAEVETRAAQAFTPPAGRKLPAGITLRRVGERVVADVVVARGGRLQRDGRGRPIAAPAAFDRDVAALRLAAEMNAAGHPEDMPAAPPDLRRETAEAHVRTVLAAYVRIGKVLWREVPRADLDALLAGTDAPDDGKPRGGKRTSVAAPAPTPTPAPAPPPAPSSPAPDAAPAQRRGSARAGAPAPVPADDRDARLVAFLTVFCGAAPPGWLTGQRARRDVRSALARWIERRVQGRLDWLDGTRLLDALDDLVRRDREG
jgi:hypothetical protein